MREILFEIGPFKVYGYGLMIAIGVIAAFAVAMYREKKWKIGDDKVFDLGIWCLIGGWISAKLLFWITELPSLIEDPSQILSTMSSGFVVYGGIIGGILTGHLFCRIKKLPFLKYFDLVMPSIALAQAFGRLGCFMAGCCYGRETTAAWGVIFPESSYAPGGVSLIPTQLISSAANFVNFLVLIFLARKTKKDGQIGGLYLIFYSIGRFIIEIFRNDPRGNVGFLSTSQFIAIFMLAAGILIFAVCAKRTQTDETGKTAEAAQTDETVKTAERAEAANEKEADGEGL